MEDWRSKMIEEHLRTQHYVAKKDTLLNRISGKCEVNINSLKLGMLVEAVGKDSDDGIRIKIKDPSERSFWHNTEWKCHNYDLIPVSKKLWHYLAAVTAPEERVKIASNKQLCKDIENIRENNRVWFSPHGSSSVNKCLATVTLIGPVPELGDGIYFGLDLQEGKEPSNTRTPTHFKFAAVNSITPCSQENLERKYLHNDILMPKLAGNFLNGGNSRNNDSMKIRDINSSILDRYGFDDSANNNRELISLTKDISLTNSVHPVLKSILSSTSDNGKGSRNLEDYNLLHFAKEIANK